MRNYGHAIRLGVEVMGDPDAPQSAVDLAVLAEQVGCESVVFADGHNEAPAADALSLASWTSARTAAIQVVPRLATTARPASVVARAAASLQLLSRNRTGLLLDPRSAPTGVDAAADAIAVIRGLHDTGRARVSHDGRHHRLAGAEAGPALTREVPMWLAGADPRAAALAGRAADGLLIDLDEVGHHVMAELNETLDQAAIDAGRDPRGGTPRGHPARWQGGSCGTGFPCG